MYVCVYIYVCIHTDIHTHMCLYSTGVQCQQRTEGDVRSPGIIVKDSNELPCGFWELNQGPLEEQPVLLTVKPSSLQPIW